MTPIQKLDTVLNILNSKEVRLGKVPVEYVQTELNKIFINKYEFDYAETERILKKLFYDKYANYDYKDQDNHRVNVSYGKTIPISTTKTKTDELYSISFNGEFFIQKGGYDNQNKIDSIALKSQSLQNVLLAYGSALAALGAFALFFLEVVKFLHEHHCCWKCH